MQETPVHDSWVGKFPRRRERLPSPVFLGSPGILGLQTVKNPPAIRETWVQSLGWEDPLDEGMATRSSIPAWRIPMSREAWRATVHTVSKSRAQLNQFSDLPSYRHRKIQVLSSYSPWGDKESDMTEQLSTAQHSCGKWFRSKIAEMYFSSVWFENHEENSLCSSYISSSLKKKVISHSFPWSLRDTILFLSFIRIQFLMDDK